MKNKKTQRRFLNLKTQIVNLSNYKLNTHEQSLLELGLNYIPTPNKEHPAKILQDFFLFECKVKLRYFSTRFPCWSNLYLLPKVHKPNNPGRLIINSKGSITETLSACVDLKLRKYSQECNSYIKDMTHFLQLIKDLKIQPNTILVTVDVNSLYTNIPHGDGIEAIRECLT